MLTGGNPLTHLKMITFYLYRIPSFSPLYQNLTKYVKQILNVASVFKCTRRLNLCF